MLRFNSAGVVCAGLLTMFSVGPLRADFPVKADIKLQFDVRFAPSGCGASAYKAPWYVYFPVDQNQNQQVPNRFPNWPGCFPPPDAAQGCPGCGPCACPSPGMTSRNFPNWPTQFGDTNGGRAQPVSYGRMDSQSNNIILTNYSNSYAPYWPSTPAYPTTCWPSYYYYGR
jgi:hypothetical protein